MDRILLISQWLLITLLLQHPDDVAGQFTAASPTCPNDTFTFRCNVTGGMNGTTVWRVDESSTCSLSHGRNSSERCGSNGVFTASPGTGFGTSTTSFSSTLSGTATPALNGTLVECFGPVFSIDAGNRVGSHRLQILGPPSVPTLSCVDLSEDVSGTVNVTVSWTLSGGDSADFYLISITTNAPQTPYEELLNITGSVTQHQLTGFMAGYEYNITVRGVNCGSLEGSESEPLTITPQVPTTPVLDVCAVYDMVNETLQIIESTWNEVDNVNISQDCPNGQNIIASYELSYNLTDLGNITTCVMNGTECSNGRCRHELQDNTTNSRCQPPVSQFSGEGVTVSVTARNIVGRSNTSVSESINVQNVYLNVGVNTTNRNNVFVECTFFQPGYTCTIDYGTDPTYSNLVYRDTSSTQGRMATITLSQRFRGDNTYYFIVSAESNSQCVRVQGSFEIVLECSVTDLVPTDGLSITSQMGTSLTCPEIVNGSSISPGTGVVCYNGTSVGSIAIYSYICNNDTSQRNETTRVCQSNGTWNGSIPSCISGSTTNIVLWILIGIDGGVVLIFIIPADIYAALEERCRRKKRTPGRNQQSCAREGKDNASKDPVKKGKWWHIVLLLISIIFLVIGVVLCIAAVVVTSILQNGNVQNGLVGSAFAVFIVTYILAVAVTWVHIYHNRNKVKRKGQFYLLVIAAVLTVLLVGLWIALAVFIYIHCRRTNKPSKNMPVGRSGPDGSEEKVAMKDVKEEEPQYSTTQHFSTSPVALLPPNPEYSQLGEHGETGGGDIYNKPIHGGHPHAVPNPVDPNYSHFKEGASRPSAEELQYEVVSTKPRHKPKTKEEEGKKKGRK